MTHSYQTFNKLAKSSDEISQLKKQNEKVERMKAAGTYCDYSDPEMSYMKFKMQSCRKCPNYDECKEESERKSMSILKYRRNTIKKSKVKRGGKKK
jgi:hypothetical protein